MSSPQIAEIELYDFPESLVGHPLLEWMGADYVQFIATELLLRFRDQNPGTLMLAMKCESHPDISTQVEEVTGTAREVAVRAALQITLQDKDGDRWRLQGTGTFTATRL